MGSGGQMNHRPTAGNIANMMPSELDTVLNAIERNLHQGQNNHLDRPEDEMVEYTAESRAAIAEIMRLIGIAADDTAEKREQRQVAVLRTLRAYFGVTQHLSVLHYSGGVGDDALSWAPACSQVAYYDPSPLVSRFAARRLKRSRIHIAQLGNIERYASYFDAVVCFSALRSLELTTTLLDELVSLVKPGGVLILAPTSGVDLRVGAGAHRAAFEMGIEHELAQRGFRQIVSADEQLLAFVRGPAVTVIVPVFNAVEETGRLLESIVTDQADYPVQWFFLDDGSTDPRVGPLLDDFCQHDATHRRVQHRRNEGFLNTCNFAMRETGEDDIILLNSDTVIYPGCFRGLVTAAYADPSVGTVTPLSNNASMFSVLQGILPGNEVNQMLALAGRADREVPTGVGFCLYLKRKALKLAGEFEGVFNPGYGEETDLCARIRRVGFRNILTEKVFVYHSGSASMVAAGISEKGDYTIIRPEHIIKERYPEYHASVLQLMESGAIPALDRDLARRYVVHMAARRSSVALIMHTDVFQGIVGGTEYHTGDLIHELQSDFVVYVIHPVLGQGATLRITAIVDGVATGIDWNSHDYKALLRDLNPGLIHVNHLMHYTADFVDALATWDGPKVFTIHDYYGVCPRYMLLTPALQFCGVPQPDTCDRCAKALQLSGTETPEHKRRMHQRLVDAVDLIVAPSQSAVNIFRRAIDLDVEKVRIVPHAVPRRAYRMLPDLRELVEPNERANIPESLSHPPAYEPSHLRVGFIGYDAEHKGKQIIQNIITACEADPITFVAIGEIANSQTHRAIASTGLYQREDVLELIRRYQLDVMILASPWPETYSYTLSEAWLAGVPVIVGPLGAPAERVAETGAGLIAPDYRPESYVALLRRLKSARDELEKLRHAVAQVLIADTFEVQRHLYAELLPQAPTATALFTGTSCESVPMSATVAQPPMIPPIIAKLVKARKTLIPVGSLRERLYFKIHDLITPAYAGGKRHEARVM